MQYLDANRALGAIPNGCTKPYNLLCAEGEQYVVKFKENPEGARVLANEYVCAKIAEVLELPLSSPSFINIDDIFIDDFGVEVNAHVGNDISTGIHFGTKKVKKTFPITNSRMLQSAQNVDIIPEIILFDHIIGNSDRDWNGGNLIFDASSMNIVVIDHTHAFELGALWNAQELNRRIGNPIDTYDTSGFVYKKLIPFVKGHNPFFTIVSKLPRLTQARLGDIISNIPDEWEICQDDKDSLQEYLCDRLNRVNELLDSLSKVLPYWKGGS
jgi:hypothetical protein